MQPSIIINPKPNPYLSLSLSLSLSFFLSLLIDVFPLSKDQILLRLWGKALIKKPVAAAHRRRSWLGLFWDESSNEIFSSPPPQSRQEAGGEGRGKKREQATQAEAESRHP